MKFRCPDDAVKAWYRAHEKAIAPPSQSIGQSGRVWARRCVNPKCGRLGTPVMLPGKKKTEGLQPKCPACCSLWEWTDEFTLAGQFNSGRGGSAPRALVWAGDSWVRLEEIRAFGDGQGEIYVQWLLEARVSRETVAVDATNQRVAGRTWTFQDVRRAIDKSRQWLRAELEYRGLLEIDRYQGSAHGGTYA